MTDIGIAQNRTALSGQSMFVNSNGLWYHKIPNFPYGYRYQMVGFPFPKYSTNPTILSHPKQNILPNSVSIRPSNEEIVGYLIDQLNLDSHRQDCGCYRYERTKKYPCIKLGECNRNQGCQKSVVIPLNQSISETSEQQEQTNETDRKEFVTPCGQTYWVDSEKYLYTNKTVEHPIAYWIPEYQCVCPIDMDSSDDEDSEPPPTPPPMYQRDI